MNSFIFWMFLCLFLSSWLAYPIILLVASLFFRKYSTSWSEPEDWPSVSVLIAARNEASVIAARIQNLLDQEYAGNLEILIGSDCSDDETDAIALSFSDRGVILYRSEERLGKPLMMQKLRELSSGEILVFSDADTVFSRQTVRELVIPYSLPSIGCVDGSRRNSLSDSTCESVYWKYETAVKKLCSSLGGILGATGAVFSIRNGLFLPLSKRRADDFELAVMVRMQDYSCVFNEAAAAKEPSPDDSVQYRRMVRIVSWMSVSCIMLMAEALRKGKLLLFMQLLIHKTLRWCSGLFLAAATVFAGILSASSFYLVLFLLMSFFHAAAAAGRLLRERLPSKLLFPYYFWLMNIAALDGILRTLTGNPVDTWEKKTKGGRN